MVMDDESSSLMMVMDDNVDGGNEDDDHGDSDRPVDILMTTAMMTMFLSHLDLRASPGLPSLVFLPSRSSRLFDPFVVIDAFVLLVAVLSLLSRGCDRF